MNIIDSAIRRARQRLFLDQMLQHTGVTLVAATTCAVVLLIISRFAGWTVAPAVYGGILVAGLVAGIAYAWLKRPPALSVAVHLDRRLGLKDRVGSVYGLQDGRHRDDPFVAMLVSDAIRRLNGIDVRNATPIRVSGIWLVVIVLAALLETGYVLVPQRQPSPPQTPPIAAGPAVTPEDRERMSEIVNASLRDVAEEDTDDPAIQEHLDALDALAQQLDGDNADVSQARDASAARLAELADQLAERAERDRAALDELTERFSGMETPETGPAPLTADEFADALQRGDFGQAADELDEMLRDADQMTSADREALAEQLRKLAEKITDSGASREREARKELLGDAMHDLGLDQEDVDRLLDSSEPLPDDLERELRSQGLDDETAAELARAIREHRKRDAVERDAEDAARDLADLMDKTARDLEPPSPDAPAQDDAADDPTAPTDPENVEPPAPAAPDDPAERDAADDATGDEGSDERAAQPEGAEQRADGADTDKPDEKAADAGQSDPKQSEQTSKERAAEGEQKAEKPGERSESEQSDAKDQQSGEAKTGEQDENAKGDGAQSNQQGADKTDAESAEQRAQKQQEQEGGERQQQQQQGQQQEDQQQQQQSDQQQGDQQQSEQQQSEQQQQQSEGQSGQGASGQSPPQEGDAGAADQKEGASPDEQPAASEQSGAASDQPQPGDADDSGDAGDPAGAGQQRDQSADQPSGEVSDVAGDNAGNQGDPVGGSQSLADRLRDLERQREQADRRRERSDQLRQRSRDLLDDADQDAPPDDAWTVDRPDQSTPPDREIGASPSGASTTDADQPREYAPDALDTVDLRDEDLGDQILARWLGDRGEPAEGATEQSGTMVERAQRSADRAVNDAAIPARYHDPIRRYFNRFRETVDRARDAGDGQGE